MKHKKLLIVVSTFLLVILLAGCTGAGGGVNNWPGMTINGDTAWLANGTAIYGVNLANGTESARLPQKTEGGGGFLGALLPSGNNYGILFAPPAVANDILIVGNYTKELFAFNLSNSTEAWRLEGVATDRWIGGALVLDNLVYAPNADGNLYVLDLKGNLVKTVAVGTQGPLWSQPVVNGETLYLSGMDHNLYAFDVNTMKLKWQTDLGGALVPSPVLDDVGNLLVGNISGLLSKVDGKTGSILVQKTLSGGIWSKPLIHDGVVYIGAQSGDFYALDEKNYDQRWVINTSASVIASPVLLPDGILYVNEAGDVVGVDFDGNENWRQKLPGQLYSDPVLVNDIILIPVKGGDVLIQAIKTNGALSWAFKPAK